jgi:PleD family two-component response regulator
VRCWPGTGGDEFALLLPSCSGAAGLRIVEELRVACARVPLSAGIAQHAPGELASQLMRRADTALYRAKADGRGRCVLYDGDQDGDLAPSGTARRAVRN